MIIDHHSKYDNNERMLRELPTCDLEAQNEQMLLENGAHGFGQARAATNIPFVKRAISLKHNKAC